MEYDLSPGDVLNMGDGVTMTIIAVEGDLIYFRLACSDDESTHGGSGV